MAGLPIPKNLVSDALFNKTKNMFGVTQGKTLKPHSEAVDNLSRLVTDKSINPLAVALQIAGKIGQGRDGNSQLKPYVSENVISVLKEFVREFKLNVDLAKIEASLVTTGANRQLDTPNAASGTEGYYLISQSPGVRSLYSPPQDALGGSSPYSSPQDALGDSSPYSTPKGNSNSEGVYGRQDEFRDNRPHSKNRITPGIRPSGDGYEIPEDPLPKRNTLPDNNYVNAPIVPKSP